jgi:16S rRNA processing protein RimM
LSGNPPGHGSSNQEQHWVWLARIRRTQGRKGEVFAEILTDFPEKFAERRNLWLVQDPSGSSQPKAEPRSIALIHHWPHKGGIVLHFAGVDSITAAESLIGLGVAIPREERAVLAQDEAYVSDLIGCTLVDVAGPAPVAIGEIEDVDTTAGPAPLLIVRGKTPGKQADEILIPFAKAYLRLLDLDHKRLEMALPEGLIDLN